MNGKNLYVIVILFFIFFLIIVISSIIFNTDKTIKPNSNIELNVYKVHEYKGVLLYNDSLALTNNCPLIGNKDFLIRAIKPPFYFKKEKYSDSILIIKDSDSLFFEFIDMN
jgi:hypothetical protein